jgi:hypothetical protein
MSSAWERRKQRKYHEQELEIKQQAAIDELRIRYPSRKPLSTLTDWVAVYVAFQSFIFLVAWQAYPEWDDTQIWPIFIRSSLVSVPITLGMWGVTRAMRSGSAVPKNMAKKIPLSMVTSDGTVKGTTSEDLDAGADLTDITTDTTTTAPDVAGN